MMDCLEKCEWQEFQEGRFWCSYYGEGLPMEVNRDIPPEHGGTKVVIFRCKQCVDEGKIGIDKKSNYLEGIRKSLVYLGDHFYSFKDEFENSLADLYRNLKKLEKGE